MTLPRTVSDLYQALVRRDPAYDGLFYAAVRTTGVFCRMTCPARKPRPENTVFYDNADEAMEAGFRPCLRCRPLERARGGSPLVAELRAMVEAEPDRKWSAQALAALGYDASTVRRAFKREYAISFARYTRQRRLGLAVARLRNGDSVMNAQIDAGYESASGFREALTRLIGERPSHAREGAALNARWLDTPIGPMLAVADEAGLRVLGFTDSKGLAGDVGAVQAALGPIAFADSPALDNVARRMDDYFAGRTVDFDFPTAPIGTDFQQRVWSELARIPLGCTRSYAWIAQAIGRPTATRAVAAANARNPLTIVTACHRVIGANGSLTGYGGQLWRKRWLLEHEARMAGVNRQGELL